MDFALLRLIVELFWICCFWSQRSAAADSLADVTAVSLWPEQWFFLDDNWDEGFSGGWVQVSESWEGLQCGTGVWGQGMTEQAPGSAVAVHISIQQHAVLPASPPVINGQPGFGRGVLPRVSRGTLVSAVIIAQNSSNCHRSPCKDFNQRVHIWG